MAWSVVNVASATVQSIMILGLSTLGFVHTVLCLIAIAAGLIVVAELLGPRQRGGLTAMYFASAVAVLATGFALPRDFDFVHGLGLVMALALLVAIPARYMFRIAGIWRPVYAV